MRLFFSKRTSSGFWAGVLLLVLPLSVAQVFAQGVALVDPASGSTGVASTKVVTFSFDLSMDESATAVSFVDAADPSTPLSFVGTWTFGYARLACRPAAAWPTGATILWSVQGLDILGDPVGADGSFQILGGPSGGTHGTNAITTCLVQATCHYNQTGTNEITFDLDQGYLFTAAVTLASNRAANTVTLTLPPPSQVVYDLMPDPAAPETFSYQDSSTSASTLNSLYPYGPYRVRLTSDTEIATEILPLQRASEQPPAPRVANFEAVRAVNSAAPFELFWDRATSTEFIVVEIGSFKTPDTVAPGALGSWATSITVPAGALQPNQIYAATITFYRSYWILTHGGPDLNVAQRATTTHFTLQTTDAVLPPPPPRLIRPAVAVDGTVAFEVAAEPGQQVTIEASSNLGPGSWTSLQTTTVGQDGRIAYRDTGAASVGTRFFRAR